MLKHILLLGEIIMCALSRLGIGSDVLEYLMRAHIAGMSRRSLHSG